MAVKSFVNDDVEIVGVEEPDDDVDEEVALELELALEDELLLLPHPAATAATTSPRVHTRKQRILITARSSHRRAKVNN
jgi:hypothetical protein